jgi:Ca-activated chloride channel family protein
MSSVAFAAVAAETGKELKLAMQRLWLTGTILPAGARLMVAHTFRSEEAKPLEVIYAFPLPRDAALRRFRVTGEGFAVRSELRPVEEAVKAYEQGIERGHLSALARQYADGLVNLTLGNIRPGETVSVQLELMAGVEAHDDGLRFRFPFTLAPSYHPRARASEPEPGAGEIELPEDEFDDLILPRWMRDASSLHEVGFDLRVRVDQPIAEISSPSHGIRATDRRVRLSAERDVPDRDLVLDVRTKAAAIGVLSGVDRENRGRFAVLVPSSVFGAQPETSRRVVLVLDRSGSMDGPPLNQARKALEACLSALSPDDHFGVIAFDNQVERFEDRLVRASTEQREAARAFLKQIHARGGTELAAAVGAASSLLGGEGGDILVLTDGQVFGTDAILAQARGTGVRLHCLGIGSASQDRFLALLARETGGVSRFVTPRERVDLPAVDLFASIGRPVARGLRARVQDLRGGAVAPDPPPAVFAGQPLVVFGEAEAGAAGRLLLEHDDGVVEVPLKIGPSPAGETIRLLQAARLITDLEARSAPEKRTAHRIDKQLEDLSRASGLASRAMALVAVVERAGDRPGELPQTRVVPVGMPQDVRFPSYFAPPAAPMAAMALLAPGRFSVRNVLARVSFDALAAVPAEPPQETDPLLELAASIETDGGMPGRIEEQRILETLATLLDFLAQGNTAAAGPFRAHVRRLIAYLESVLDGLGEGHREIVERVLETAREAKPPTWQRPKGRLSWDDFRAG